MMLDISLQQLAAFDAVVSEGGFQAAADKLGRSQPAVFSAVKALETQLGLALLDRGGYRVTLTEAGRAFRERAHALIGDATALRDYARQLAMGEETQLSVVIGDLSPMGPMLGLLRRFFDGCPGTMLNLHFEAISGPWERLADGEADLILHHIDRADPALEFIDLMRVTLIPVAAPGFLGFAVSRAITPEMMRRFPQCVIRDTARRASPRGYYLIEGAPRWTVADQAMKREIILRGMGWGHMPDFLVADDVANGQLLDLTGDHLRGDTLTLVAARRRDRPHGPVAQRLWRYVAEQARELQRIDASGENA